MPGSVSFGRSKESPDESGVFPLVESSLADLFRRVLLVRVLIAPSTNGESPGRMPVRARRETLKLLSYRKARPNRAGLSYVKSTRPAPGYQLYLSVLHPSGRRECLYCSQRFGASSLRSASVGRTPSGRVSQGHVYGLFSACHTAKAANTKTAFNASKARFSLRFAAIALTLAAVQRAGRRLEAASQFLLSCTASAQAPAGEAQPFQHLASA